MKLVKMLDPLGQAWKCGNALAAKTLGRETVKKTPALRFPIDATEQGQHKRAQEKKGGKRKNIRTNINTFQNSLAQN